MSDFQKLKEDLKKFSDNKRAENFKWFFKTGKGEYGEGDLFIGLTVPQCRALSKKYQDLSLADISRLLHSKIHEERLIGLLILVIKFEKSSKAEQKKIFNFYLSNTRSINNWDLVDLSCYKIVGQYLLDKPKDILYKLAKSENIWERRISIISTARFITRGNCEETLKIAEILLKDKHDLIHKAVGWMLREVGKRSSQEKEEEFLNKYSKIMPRTMLRYAIERFPEGKRKYYLS